MTEWGDAGALAGNIPPNQRAAAVYQNPVPKTREGGGAHDTELLNSILLSKVTNSPQQHTQDRI